MSLLEMTRENLRTNRVLTNRMDILERKVDAPTPTATQDTPPLPAGRQSPLAPPPPEPVPLLQLQALPDPTPVRAAASPVASRQALACRLRLRLSPRKSKQ